MKPNKFLQKRSGIYGIRNIINDKIYVGKTKCMYRRCHQYIYDFRERSIGHINDYLFNAINKIGIDNFEFFPLEFCSVDMTSELELEWMVRLKSTDRNHGYNLRMDTSTKMITSIETSEKISNNLRKQWANGVRDGHSQKLRDRWANDPERRKKQGESFSQIKTKFEYEVHHPNGDIEQCLYSRLVELGLKNVISNFHRQNSNDVECKGFRVIRFNKGERNEN